MYTPTGMTSKAERAPISSNTRQAFDLYRLKKQYRKSDAQKLVRPALYAIDTTSRNLNDASQPIAR
ncbi:hypothetical protein RT94_08930 [Pseudomonas viridiflava]|nr:hypothetical protein RT94_08930 [Pseudomonas viridiflava]